MCVSSIAPHVVKANKTVIGPKRFHAGEIVNVTVLPITLFQGVLLITLSKVFAVSSVIAVIDTAGKGRSISDWWRQFQYGKYPCRISISVPLDCRLTVGSEQVAPKLKE